MKDGREVGTKAWAGCKTPGNHAVPQAGHNDRDETTPPPPTDNPTTRYQMVTVNLEFPCQTFSLVRRRYTTCVTGGTLAQSVVFFFLKAVFRTLRRLVRTADSGSPSVSTSALLTSPTAAQADHHSDGAS